MSQAAETTLYHERISEERLGTLDRFIDASLQELEAQFADFVTHSSFKSSLADRR